MDPVTKSEALENLLTAVSNWFNDQTRGRRQFERNNRRDLLEAWQAYEQTPEEEETP